MTIKLVTFDLDDTLWDNLSLIMAAEKEMINWIQERVPSFPDAYRENAGRYRIQAVERRPQIQYDMNKVRFAVLEGVLQDCSSSKVEAHELARSALCIFHGRRNQFLFFEGAEETLSVLAEKYTLASVTNGTSDIHRSTVGKYFDLSLSAANLQAAKPNPIMFYSVLSQCGVRPQEAVHVGDHPVDDIECAAKIGMHTIQFHLSQRERPREVSPQAAHVVNRLHDIPGVVDEIARG